MSKGPASFVLATANPDKVAELQMILGAAVRLVARPEWVPEVEEDAETLVGNARLKAMALREATGQPALADDTGLFVEALGGAPGVHSARFAGPGATYADNVAALLAAMEGKEDRRCEFRTVALAALGEGGELWVEGRLRGRLLERPRGHGGFGYDPIFVPEGAEASFAEMTAQQKNRSSHRFRAFSGLAVLIQLLTHS